ncbi:MAG: four helix bundle protein [Saprospiraceae bacterium]
MRSFYTYSFERLEVWQLARAFKKEIYQITLRFPSEEKFGYTSQIRRAAPSITVNLAEGSGRASNVDKANFTNMAYTSALEVIDHLIGVYDLEFISEELYTSLRIDLDHIINKLNALYKYQMKQETSLKQKIKTGSIE